MNKSFKHVLKSLLAKLMSALLVVGAIFAFYSLNSTTVHATDISNLIAESNGNQETEAENGQEDTVYYINFYFDGELVGTQEAHYGDPIEFPTNVPISNKDGDPFAFWATENETVVGDEDIDAVFFAAPVQPIAEESEEGPKELVVFEFIFYDIDGNVMEAHLYEKGQNVVMPSLPVDMKWDHVVEKCTGNNENFYAVKKEVYTISFYDGEELIDSNDVYEGEPIPGVKLGVKEDETYEYVFIGWDHEVPSVATQNDTFYAQYDKVLRKYIINFYFGDELVDTQVANYGDQIEFPDVPETDAFGHLFGGWDCNGETVIGDEDIYALFLVAEEGKEEIEPEKEEMWILEFHTVNEGYKSVWVTDGQKINAPELPDGYKWSPEVPEYFSPIIGASHEFYAIPESSYRIVFNNNGYSDIQIVAEGEAIVVPELPENMKWSPVVPTNVNEDIISGRIKEFYAIPVSTYTIIFEDECGDIIETQYYEIGETIVPPTVNINNFAGCDHEPTTVTGDDRFFALLGKPSYDEDTEEEPEEPWFPPEEPMPVEENPDDTHYNYFVEFYDASGLLLSYQPVNEGDKLLFVPELPEDMKWDSEVPKYFTGDTSLVFQMVPKTEEPAIDPSQGEEPTTGEPTEPTQGEDTPVDPENPNAGETENPTEGNEPTEGENTGSEGENPSQGENTTNPSTDEGNTDTDEPTDPTLGTTDPEIGEGTEPTNPTTG